MRWITSVNIFVLISFQVVFGGSEKQDCLVDPKGDVRDPNNHYSCLQTQDCCTEYGRPSCCGKKDPTVIIRDQLLLWGGLLGFLTLLGFVIYCRQNDFYVLEGRPLSQRFCPCISRANVVESNLQTNYKPV